MSPNQHQQVWVPQAGRVAFIAGQGQHQPNRIVQKRTRPYLDGKFLQSGHCSTFRLYLTNFVRSWTNQAQKIRIVIYNQTV